MYLSSRVLVFSDLNCPFCFTLNEWLNEFGLADRVKWVGVEHKPDLPGDGENEQEDRDLLSFEVKEVQRRAPEVDVRLPSLWMNTRRALLIQCAVEDDHPGVAAALRTRLFRALWHEGRNISADRVIDECLERNGLTKESVLFLDQEQLQEQTRWWKAELDRIPAMVAPTGARHLGLQNRASVQSFILGALHELPPGPSCR